MCRNRCTDPLAACRDCDRERLAHLEAAHEFDLICQADPSNDPTHRPATDAEWRAWREATTLPARSSAA